MRSTPLRCSVGLCQHMLFHCRRRLEQRETQLSTSYYNLCCSDTLLPWEQRKLNDVPLDKNCLRCSFFRFFFSEKFCPHFLSHPRILRAAANYMPAAEMSALCSKQAGRQARYVHSSFIPSADNLAQTQSAAVDIIVWNAFRLTSRHKFNIPQYFRSAFQSHIDTLAIFPPQYCQHGWSACQSSR